MKEKIAKLDFIKIKNLCSVKDTRNKKISHRLGEKSLQNMSDKGLESKIQRTLKTQQ